jgi:hypothetical protein
VTLGPIRPARAFLTLSLAFGAAFLAVTPPLQAPDESRHLMRAFLIAEGTFLAERIPGQVASVLVPRSLFEMKARLAPKARDGDRRQDPARLRAELREALWPEDRVRIALPSLYSPLPYAPQALGVLAGRALGAPPVAFVWLGRALNLAFYVGCVYLALRIAPAHGFAFLLLALTPMALFEAASLAADGSANALAFLLAAAVLRAADPARPSVGAREVAALALVASALALTKQAYAPLAAAALAIPAARFRSRRAWLVSVAAVTGAALLAAGLWFAALRGLELPRLTYASDPAAQLRWMAAHPLEAAVVFAHTALARADTWLRTFVGVLGSLDVPLPTAVYAVHPLVLLVAVALDGGPRSPVRGARRAVLLGVVGATGLGVLLLAYVGWTRPGDDTVRHVQGRYFIPLAPFAAAALHLPNAVRVPGAARAAALAWSAAALALSVAALADRYWSAAALLACAPLAFAVRGAGRAGARVPAERS